jgi:hypothetical protein
MKACILGLTFFFGLAGLAVADVIRMEDGTLYLGRMASSAEGVVSIEAFGKSIQVASSQIAKSEPDITVLHELPVEVTLMDGSIIRGKIKNYDEEVGLFVELAIGELTVPLESLRAIEDPAQRARYRGFPAQVALLAGYFIPVGTIAPSFGSGFTASLSAELSLPILRGLYAGVDVSQFFMTYLPSNNLTYSVTTATFGPFYRLLLFRTSPVPVLRDLVPWFGLGGGIAYVGANDTSTSTTFGEVDPAYFAAIGLDFYIGERIQIRLSIRWLALQQATQLLHMPSAGIGVAVSF